jgi:phosphoglycolate phosphatase
MIELAVFDWNGTLFADSQACVDSGNDLIRHFGGQPISKGRYIKEFDFPVVDFLCAQGCDREALLKPESAEVFHHYYEPRAAKCRTRRGTRYTLNQLKDRSIDSVILSNHMTHAIVKQLERLHLTDYFDEVLGNGDYHAVSKGKNKVERIVGYMARKDHNPKNAFIVGDSPEDIEVGKELGIVTVGITDGYFYNPRLRASNPDYLVSTVAQVMGVVDELSL